MSNEAHPAPEEQKLPDDLDSAVRLLEDKIMTDMRRLEETMPDPLAPLSEWLAYTLATARLRAESEVVEELQRAHDDDSAAPDRT